MQGGAHANETSVHIVSAKNDVYMLLYVIVYIIGRTTIIRSEKMKLIILFSLICSINVLAQKIPNEIIIPIDQSEFQYIKVKNDINLLKKYNIQRCHLFLDQYYKNFEKLNFPKVAEKGTFEEENRQIFDNTLYQIKKEVEIFFNKISDVNSPALLPNENFKLLNNQVNFAFKTAFGVYQHRQENFNAKNIVNGIDPADSNEKIKLENEIFKKKIKSMGIDTPLVKFLIAIFSNLNNVIYSLAFSICLNIIFIFYVILKKNM